MKHRFRLMMSLITALSCSQATAATIYSQDPVLSHFTSTVNSYATFISGYYSGGSLPYTPTSAGLLAGGYGRMIGGMGFGSVVAEFGTATANIVVFDDIDHAGVDADVYQYAIYGSNDNSAYSLLFDPQSANATADPNAFTLGSYVGTAPTLENNTLTYGPGNTVGAQGVTGYQEYFTFAMAYKYYKFVPSTLTVNTFENETELDAVGDATPSQEIIDTSAPEPGTLLIGGGGLAVIGLMRRRKA